MMTRLLLVLLIFLSCAFSADSAAQKKKKKKDFNTKLYTDICLSKKKLSSRRDHKALQWLLQTSGELSIASETSHQHKAACWVLHDDSKKVSVGKHLTQRYALAVLYHATQGDKHWDIKTNWMSSKSECQWYGVECDVWGNIVGLDLGFNELNGLLPRELALLQKIQEVDFHGNDLQGVLPHLVMHAWKDCKILRLHMNGFFGALHTEIGLMKSLEELHLFGNYFGGALPTELANLKSLKVLDIYANAFEGTIPSELGNLKQLKEMDVHDNFFVGNMPQAVCDRNLKFLVADCLDGAHKEIGCKCCTICCEGLPNMRCIDQKTKQEVIVGTQ
jgi:Leucine-rich repeat (LRR) protein